MLLFFFFFLLDFACSALDESSDPRLDSSDVASESSLLLSSLRLLLSSLLLELFLRRFGLLCLAPFFFWPSAGSLLFFRFLGLLAAGSA